MRVQHRYILMIDGSMHIFTDKSDLSFKHTLGETI